MCKRVVISDIIFIKWMKYKTIIVKALFIKVASSVLCVRSLFFFWETILWTTTVSIFNSFSVLCATLNTCVIYITHNDNMQKDAKNSSFMCFTFFHFCFLWYVYNGKITFEILLVEAIEIFVCISIDRVFCC